eukprot:TRINITY_DN106001_c0_g1_i1.p1 TRINITY_DN106001_c0_g1~~TRINITY_DN106001_c0_g1_i1.p1  ORF type:complete len:701 (+),score=160.91 TRINITY_DN106001_c0_g1_i1:23-2104(+)
MLAVSAARAPLILPGVPHTPSAESRRVCTFGEGVGSTGSLPWARLGGVAMVLGSRALRSRRQRRVLVVKACSAESSAALQAFIDDVNEEYEQVHSRFEEQFWGTKMALREGDFSVDALTRTKGEMESFLADPGRLAETRKWIESGVADEKQAKTLDMFVRTFQCYIMESEEALTLRKEGTEVENALQAARNTMKLGADLPDGFVELSSVQLRMKMTTDADEEVRKASYEGLNSIGAFVCENGFVELVKKRNRMAKALGYVDFYDYKVTQAEGFNKERLFEILDTLEVGTREQLTRAKANLIAEKGEDSLKPWNTEYMTAGDITKKLDPYFPFETAVDCWSRSYAALGIKYKNATMTLDLLERKGKYSNGFCHWPQPPWQRSDGSWQPSGANFTSLADPTQVGSGYKALATLMHEAGHAAHMANVVQPSPLFAQERAPMSVAYAENQSMFLDSLVGDAAWRGRYARDRNGKVVPWELVEEDLRCKHPFAVFTLRKMIAVPYFEKALYELPEEEVTAERIQELAEEVEQRITGGASTYPLLAIPHILSDEASCYYHGYVLAEMAVHQTRAYFLEKDGHIVDNPNVGPTLAEKYWRPGNSAVFLDVVEALTGKPLTGKAWVQKLEKPMSEVLREERVDYEAAVEKGPAAGTGDVDLEMRVRFVDGDLVIADSKEAGFSAATAKFADFVKSRVPIPA